jgi:uncharacterized protein (DUF2267 family)
METLINEIMQSAGLSREQAEQAVMAVLNRLKGQMPKALGDQLQNAIEGLEIKLGPVFNEVGKDKILGFSEKASEEADKLKHQASDAIDSVKDKFNKLF